MPTTPKIWIIGSMFDNQSASIKKCTCFWNWTIAVLH